MVERYTCGVDKEKDLLQHENIEANHQKMIGEIFKHIQQTFLPKINNALEQKLRWPDNDMPILKRAQKLLSLPYNSEGGVQIKMYQDSDECEGFADSSIDTIYLPTSTHPSNIEHVIFHELTHVLNLEKTYHNLSLMIKFYDAKVPHQKWIGYNGLKLYKKEFIVKLYQLRKYLNGSSVMDTPISELNYNHLFLVRVFRKKGWDYKGLQYLIDNLL